MRAALRLLAASSGTGLTGLLKNPNARWELITTYEGTLKALALLPKESVYRRSTESLTQQRLKIAKAAEDADKIESEIDEGLIEELLMTARAEAALADHMNEFKA